jgi:hypothetical protein
MEPYRWVGVVSLAFALPRSYLRLRSQDYGRTPFDPTGQIARHALRQSVRPDKHVRQVRTNPAILVDLRGIVGIVVGILSIANLILELTRSPRYGRSWARPEGGSALAFPGVDAVVSCSSSFRQCMQFDPIDMTPMGTVKAWAT